VARGGHYVEKINDLRVDGRVSIWELPDEKELFLLTNVRGVSTREGGESLLSKALGCYGGGS